MNKVIDLYQLARSLPNDADLGEQIRIILKEHNDLYFKEWVQDTEDDYGNEITRTIPLCPICKKVTG